MSDLIVPKLCPSKALADVMSEENSSNGRAIGTAFDELDFDDFVEHIAVFVAELAAETWLTERKRSNKQWSSLFVVVVETTEFVVSFLNERDSIRLDVIQREIYGWDTYALFGRALCR